MSHSACSLSAVHDLDVSFGLIKQKCDGGCRSETPEDVSAVHTLLFISFECENAGITTRSRETPQGVCEDGNPTLSSKSELRLHFCTVHHKQRGEASQDGEAGNRK